MAEGAMSDELWTGPAVERIDGWERGFAARAAQAKALAERTAGLLATAEEADGLIEVTVGSNGQVTGLRLDEGIRRQPAATTARQIMAAIRAAKAELTRQFRSITAETVGVDSETGRAVMAGLAARLAEEESA
jgi:DNA-binding protein YbaB